VYILQTFTSKICVVTTVLVAGLQTIFHAQSTLMIHIVTKFYFLASSDLLEIAIKSNPTASCHELTFLTFCQNIISTRHILIKKIEQSASFQKYDRVGGVVPTSEV
jgi:hypothetical protein